MKTKLNEDGITLIALIITIIVLVILAAVTLNSIFGSNIIGLATNGAINYAEEQQKELDMLNDVSDMLGDITGDTDRPMSPTITLSGTKGNNDIYTSNVMVTISINKGLEQTENIKLHYKINDEEEQITEEDVSFEVNTEGTTTIIAWAENEKGNVSGNANTSFTINKTAPSTPTISLSGETGDNNYYISNVGVTISAGDVADVANIKYKVEGANPIAETEQAGTTANFDITQDGTSTITAYIINNAGLTSETITQVVNKDTTNPNTSSLAVGTIGETSISVTANGADATSGVVSYTFQYSTTSETDEFTTALEVQNTANSCTYPYQGLASNTTYYLRVIVKDRAGNTTPSTAINVTTKQSGLSEEVLASNVGAYVDYTPTTGSFTSEGQYNGYGNQSFSTVTGLKWRILEANDNILTLISDTTANTSFPLNGANGYNNGVLLLNNACKAMYSNESLGATGRNLNIDDIERVSTYDKTTYTNSWGFRCGNEYTSTYDSYPNMFTQEKIGAIDGIYGSKYELSEQNEYIQGKGTITASISGMHTGYSYTMTTDYINSTYLELFRYKADTTTNLNAYWLSSRSFEFVTGMGNATQFCLFLINNGSVSTTWLYNGVDRDVYPTWGSLQSYAIRPVVEIDLNKVNVGLTGDGSSSSPFSIEAK